MDNEDFILTTEDAIEWENKLVFVSKEINLICSVDLSTYRIEIVGHIPEEELWGYRLCSKIMAYDDKLYFLPMNGKKIWGLNMKNHSWNSVEIEDGSICMKIMQAMIWRNRLFMIGCNYPAIICMNLKNEKITYIKEPFNKLKENLEEIHDPFFRCDYVQIGETIFLACCLDNSVLKLELNSFKWKFIKIGNEKNRYSGIAWDGKYFWLSPRMFGPVVRWDGHEQVTEFPIPDNESKDNLLYTGVCYKEDKIIFPAKDGCYTLEMMIKKPQNIYRSPEQYLFYKKTDQNRIIYGKPDGELTVMYPDGSVKRMKCRVPFVDVLRYWKGEGKSLFSEKIIENTSLSLNVFLSLISRNDKELETGRKEIEVGEKIWNRIIN